MFPFAKWEVAKRISDQQPGFLLQVPSGPASGDRHSTIRDHSQLNGARLQSFELESADSQTLLFSAVPAGRCLSERLKPGQALSPAKVCKLGIVIAQSLDLLHKNSLVHGQVRLDRIWIAKKEPVILLRDPAAQPTRQGRSDDDQWLQSRDLPSHYAAPEFADPNQPADAATDIYSLGCVLFRLVTGRWSVDSDSWDQALVQHCQTSPPELVTAVDQAADGDPLMRVIAHAMAKNRKARFATAGQMAVALHAALPTASDSVQAIPIAKKQEPAAPILSIQDPVPSRESRRKSKSYQPLLIIGAVATAALLLLLGLIASRSGQSKPDRTVQATAPMLDSETPAVPLTDQANAVTAGPKLSNGYRLVADDQLLYVPPYEADSPSVSLALLPPGPAAIASIRPQILNAGTDGDSLGDVFADELESLVSTMAARAGVPADSIERCTIAIHPARGESLQVSLAVRLDKPVALNTLIENLQVAESRTSDGMSIYTSDNPDADAYFFEIADDKMVSRYAVGSVPMMTEVAGIGGSEIVLPRNLRSLWDHANANSDFSAMATASFLFADGRTILQSSIPKVIEPLKKLLVPDVSAGLLVVKFDENNMYAESRLSPAGGTNPIALMRAWQERISMWPQWADQFVLESQPDPSWRLLATRLPLMMRFVANQTRIGISDGVAMGNLYLPRRVVPQLAVSISLALNTDRRSGSPAVVREPTGDTPSGLTLEQMLDRKLSVSFDQESLEFAIDTVVDEFRRTLPDGSSLPAVRIIGADLQKMGITQNQQIRGFNKSDASLRSVLTDLMLEANPDRSASGPSDAKQALVWVVADDPTNPGDKAIFVTTREASRGRYDLPREFRVQQ